MPSPLTPKTLLSIERWNPWRIVRVTLLQYQYAHHLGLLLSNVHHDIDRKIALRKMGLHQH